MKRLHLQSMMVGANGMAFVATLLLGALNADPVYLLIAALNAFAVAVNWHVAGRLQHG